MHPTRDFNFVTDTVNGFIKALQTDAGIGEVINLGSHFEISIGDTARTIAEVLFRSLPTAKRSASGLIRKRCVPG